MTTYMRPASEQHSVAVKLWQHELMHTSRPRRLLDKATDIDYWWHLQWRDGFPHLEHYTWQCHGATKILNIRLLCFINDILRGVTTFADDLATDQTLQENYTKMQQELVVKPFTP